MRLTTDVPNIDNIGEAAFCQEKILFLARHLPTVSTLRKRVAGPLL
jgi:hypothetical protein